VERQVAERLQADLSRRVRHARHRRPFAVGDHRPVRHRRPRVRARSGRRSLRARRDQRRRQTTTRRVVVHGLGVSPTSTMDSPRRTSAGSSRPLGRRGHPRHVRHGTASGRGASPAEHAGPERPDATRPADEGAAAAWTGPVNTGTARTDRADVDALLSRPDGCVAGALPTGRDLGDTALVRALGTWIGRPA
jgi:hypothetical protein